MLLSRHEWPSLETYTVSGGPAFQPSLATLKGTLTLRATARQVMLATEPPLTSTPLASDE
jgi:hypothetical protein